MIDYSRVIKGFVSNLFTKLIIALYAVISVPILVANLDIEGYGVVVFITQITPFIFLLEFGLVNALGRTMARYRGMGDYESLNSIFVSTFWFLVLISLITSILLIVFNYSKNEIIFTDWLNLEILKEFDYLFLILFLMIITIPLRSFRGILESEYKFYVIDKINILVRVIAIIALVSLSILDRLNLNLAILITVGMVILPEILCFLVYRREKKLNILNLTYLKKDSILEQLDVGAAGFLTTLGAIIVRQGFVVLFSLKAGIDSIHIMSIPLMIVLIISPIVGRVSAIYLPIFSELSGNNKNAESEEQLRKSFFILSTLSIIAIAIFSFAGNEIIYLWLGNSFPSSDVTKIFIITFLFLTFTLIARSFLMFRSYLKAYGHHRYVAFVSICSAVWVILAAAYSEVFIANTSLSMWQYFSLIFISRLVIFDIIVTLIVTFFKCDIKLNEIIVLWLKKIFVFGVAAIALGMLLNCVLSGILLKVIQTLIVISIIYFYFLKLKKDSYI